MKHRIHKKTSPIALLFLCLLFALPVCASSTDSKISETKQEQKELEEKKAQSEQELEDLKESQQQLESDKQTLDQELEELSKEVASIGSNLSEKQSEIDKAVKKLEKTKKLEEQQYAEMKQRIKYFYESGGVDLMEVFVTSESFGDFLNRVDYANQIAEYDRRMLKSYEKTRKLIASTEKKLRKEKDELKALKAQAEEKQDQVSARLSAAQSKLSSNSNEISDAEGEVSAYEEQLKEQEKKLDDLKRARDEEMAKKIAAEKKKKQQAAAKSDGSGSGSSGGSGSEDSGGSSDNNVKPTIQAGDLELMAAIIECEAGGESYTGKLAVGSVVMNRVRSSYFPNTISGVIYQSGQFSPVASGRFAVVLARGANDICRQAAEESMNGSSVVGDCLFFRRVQAGDSAGDGRYIIGNHYFY